MERIGGVLCLDFLNTVDGWPAPSRDDLLTPADLFRWASDGELTLADQPTAADVAQARALRDTLLEVFSAVLEGRAPRGQAVQWLVAEAGASDRPPVTTERPSGSVQLTWPQPLSAADLRSSIAFSGVSLLLRGPLGRVKACATCGWFFLDTSRNGTRRWCSMQWCGSRAKARTYATNKRQPAR